MSRTRIPRDACVPAHTVRGKILEGGNFGELIALKSLARKKFGESVGSLLKTLALINIGGENFGELPTIRQIRQNFPPPKFSHVRYITNAYMFYKSQ